MGVAFGSVLRGFAGWGIFMIRRLLDPHIGALLAVVGAAKDARARATGIPETWDVIPTLLVMKWPESAPPFRRVTNCNGWRVDWETIPSAHRIAAFG